MTETENVVEMRDMTDHDKRIFVIMEQDRFSVKFKDNMNRTHIGNIYKVTSHRHVKVRAGDKNWRVSFNNILMNTEFPQVKVTG